MGPLEGVKVVEIGGSGPGAFCGMLLSDLGADVLRVDRPPAGPIVEGLEHTALLGRGRRSVAVDLRHPDGPAAILRLSEHADALIEGFRPGVCERLGVGPQRCLERNPRLVYGRITGWGRDGPLAVAPGHDINYIALAGALGPIGRAGTAPVPPLSLVGDFGGGGMLLALGVACALFRVRATGEGQIVDAAMIDGAALQTTIFHELRAQGQWSDERGTNLVDTGAPFYEVYETADGEYLAVGAIEPRFYAELLRSTGIDAEGMGEQWDRSRWPVMKQRFADLFRTRTRAEWCELLEGTDACVAPVLSLGEAPEHPHNVHRGTFTEVGGVVQPAPAPRFSETPPDAPTAGPRVGEHTDEALLDWGFSGDEIAALRDTGVVT